MKQITKDIRAEHWLKTHDPSLSTAQRAEAAGQVPRRDSSSTREAMGQAGSAGGGERDKDRAQEVRAGAGGGGGGGAGPSVARAGDRGRQEHLEATASWRQGIR